MQPLEQFLQGPFFRLCGLMARAAWAFWALAAACLLASMSWTHALPRGGDGGVGGAAEEAARLQTLVRAGCRTPESPVFGHAAVTWSPTPALRVPPPTHPPAAPTPAPQTADERRALFSAWKVEHGRSYAEGTPEVSMQCPPWSWHPRRTARCWKFRPLGVLRCGILESASAPPLRPPLPRCPPQHEARFQTWSSALDAVVHHNLHSDEPHALGLNAFSDLTPAQFRAQMLASSSEEEQRQPEVAAAADPHGPGVDASAGNGMRAVNAQQPGSRGDGDGDGSARRSLLLAAQFDWRTTGAIQPVESQGQCTSGYIFAAMALVEATTFIWTGVSVALSKQQILDCSGSYGDRGCSSGLPREWVRGGGARGVDFFLHPTAASPPAHPWNCPQWTLPTPALPAPPRPARPPDRPSAHPTDQALQYVHDKGVQTAAAYPYIGSDQQCRKMGGNYSFTGVVALSALSDDLLKQVRRGLGCGGHGAGGEVSCPGCRCTPPPSLPAALALPRGCSHCDGGVGGAATLAWTCHHRRRQPQLAIL